MHKIIEANQSLPYILSTSSKLFSRKKISDLVYIAKKNIPDLTTEQLFKMFQILSKTGCSCAFLANCLIEQLSLDPVNFEKTFGYSYIDSSGDIDCNRVMVDIFSKLYGVIKAKIIEYNYFTFKNVKEATQNLLGKQFSDDSQAFLQLFENGYATDGLNPDGDLVFVTRSPKITNHIGTCEQIAKEKYGVEGVNSIEELQKICFTNSAQLEYKDLQIYEKLTGLGTQKFNFWSNYYLKQYHVDFEVKNEAIIVSDFNGDYQAFMEYINNLLAQGYSISVASTNNTDTYIHTNRLFSYTKISSREAGHIMKLKGFNKAGDFLVSSYGEEFILSKEYFPTLEFQKISTRQINQDKQYEEESDVVKVAL